MCPNLFMEEAPCGSILVSDHLVHTKTIVNANASKRKLFYAFRPSVHTKTMKTLTVNA